MTTLTVTLTGKSQTEELMKHVRDLTVKKEISHKDYTLRLNPDKNTFGVGDTVHLVINAVNLLAPYLILYFTRRGDERDKNYIKIEYEIAGANGAKIKVNREFKSDKELAAFLESLNVPLNTPSA